MTPENTENDLPTDEHAGTCPGAGPNDWARTLRVAVDSDDRTENQGVTRPAIVFPSFRDESLRAQLEHGLNEAIYNMFS